MKLFSIFARNICLTLLVCCCCCKLFLAHGRCLHLAWFDRNELWQKRFSFIRSLQRSSYRPGCRPKEAISEVQRCRQRVKLLFSCSIYISLDIVFNSAFFYFIMIFDIYIFSKKSLFTRFSSETRLMGFQYNISVLRRRSELLSGSNATTASTILLCVSRWLMDGVELAQKTTQNVTKQKLR